MKVLRQLDILHALSVNPRLLVVAAELLLREDLEKNDKAYAITQVSREVIDANVLHLDVFVAPPREGLLLNALPFRV